MAVVKPLHGGGGTPLSRIWSEGGSRVVVERQPPPSRIWSEGGSRVVMEKQPSCGSSE